MSSTRTAQGSWTHPNLSRLIYGDGKVITPLFKARPGDTKLDKATGELRPVRAEADADLHFEGTGETAWGTKWVIIAARGTEHPPPDHPRRRLGPDKGGEAAIAVDTVERLVPTSPAPRASSTTPRSAACTTRRIMRDLGLLSINRVALAKAGTKKPRRHKADQRQEKSTLHRRPRPSRSPTEPSDHRRPVCTRRRARHRATRRRRLDWASNRFAGSAPIAAADKSGRFRWYNDYALPDDLGGTVITVRLHGNHEDGRGSSTAPRTSDRSRRRPRLRSALPAAQRRRVDQPRPRGHPLPPASTLGRPRTPAPQPHRLGPHGQQPHPGRAPSQTAGRTRRLT